ncbi:meiosis 1 arrest protein isoform X2 [Pseudoliparis swirei]|uniref:meiosis 1 arrest protein isoform X2 n=1 Tax=Pseudoliparis swirei TaxID=2059687 RepID=UPI0024BD96AD|nr:meiosis 1 arrest protein isoform X2 [Pseudoliparis swirei]
MSMDNRKRPAGSSNSGNLVYWSSSFPRQPARVLIVEALPPWWSETCPVLCDALDNFLSLACSLDGPCRIPLLSLYAISRQQECLLPFVQVRGNLARLRSCVEELRTLPGEGCIRGAARGGELLRQAVLDSLQQFKQYIRHTSTGSQASNNISVEVTVVTSQPGRGVVRHLEAGLKGADLVSLKRLLVVQICSAADWGQDNHSPEAGHAETDDSLMLGTEVDLQRVENSVFTMETVLKAWLQEQGGDREHLHLLLPNPSADNPIPVCVKCDMQERLISPALIPLSPNLGVKTESIRDFLPLAKGSANQGEPPRKLKVIKAVTCSCCFAWRLHRGRRLEAQPSPSLSLLLKPVVSRELLLPCSLPVSTQEPAADAVLTIQGCLTQLDEECVFNPLSLSSNLYQHLRSRGLLSQPRYPYRLQPAAAHRDPAQPLEGSKATGSSRQPRQPQSHGRQLGMNSKARATVAPLPSSSSHSSSSLGPPPVKASRPALKLLSSSSGGRRAPAPTRKEEDNGDDDSMVMQ